MICLFKCPGCGEDMRFDIDSQKLICDTCNREMLPEEYDFSNVRMDGEKLPFDEINCYQCPSCGAEIILEEGQAMGVCAYCGTDLAVFDSTEGRYAPEKIIACKINKEQAFNKFATWWSGHEIMPKFNEKKMKLKMHCIYIPVWLFDANVMTNMAAIMAVEDIYDSEHPQDEYEKFYSKRLQLENEGNKKYTGAVTMNRRLNYQGAGRCILSEYKRIPNIASGHFSEKWFHGIEPYDYSQLEDFSPAYLSGFSAEQYYLTPEDVFPKFIRRATSYGKEQCIRHMTSGITGRVSLEKVSRMKQQVEPKEIDYALVPLWVFCYTYQRKKHYAYVNGQTGKTDGEIVEEHTMTNIMSVLSFISYELIAFPCFAFLVLFLMQSASVTQGTILYIVYGTAGVINLIQRILLNNGSLKAQKKRKEYTDGIDKGVLDKYLGENTITRIIGRTILGAYGTLFSLYLCIEASMQDVSLTKWILFVAIVFSVVVTFVYSRYRFKQFVNKEKTQEEVEYTDYLEPYSTNVISDKFLE